MSRRLGAVDIGTNSIRMLLQEKNNGKLIDILQKREIARLGSGWEETGYIPREKIEKAKEILEYFYKLIQEYRVDRVYWVATEALRRAQNNEQVKKELEKATKNTIRIIDGGEEARLSYLGASSGWQEKTPWVVDIGGGSTELIGPGGKSQSFRIGALVLREKWGEGSFRDMEKDIHSELNLWIKDCEIPFLIGLGGTIASLGAIRKKIKNYSEKKVHATSISLEWLESLIGRMEKMSLKERKNIVGLEKGREDIIIPGALILKKILQLSDLEQVTYSGRDILHGIIKDQIQ